MIFLGVLHATERLDGTVGREVRRVSGEVLGHLHFGIGQRELDALIEPIGMPLKILRSRA